MKYSNPEEFREAIEQHLREQARKRGRDQEYISLCEELAIERFVARIGTDVAIVKGGAAAMFATPNMPHTRDVDLIIVEATVQALRLPDMDPGKRAYVLGDLIQDLLKSGAKTDLFRFKLEEAYAITDLKPGDACARVIVTVMVGKTELHFMQVDIALQVGEIPSRIIQVRDLLNFAEVSNPQVRTVTDEYLIAVPHLQRLPIKLIFDLPCVHRVYRNV